MLSNLQAEIASAAHSRRAVAGFNVYNLELARSVIAAAEQLRSPVFLQSNYDNVQAAGGKAFVAFLRQLGSDAGVPVALHLDHGKTVDEVQQALDMGFTSVMYDGSALSFEENVVGTRAAVELARAYGALVEGELGAIRGEEDRLSGEGEASGSDGAVDESTEFTDPEQARQFVEETKVDILAVAVGNVHGQYKGEPRLNFDLLQEIYVRTGTPLALHGASGLSAEDLRRAARCGVVKVNFNTDLRRAFTGGLQTWLREDDGALDFGALRRHVMEPVVDVVARRLDWLGGK